MEASHIGSAFTPGFPVSSCSTTVSANLLVCRYMSLCHSGWWYRYRRKECRSRIFSRHGFLSYYARSLFYRVSWLCRGTPVWTSTACSQETGQGKLFSATSMADDPRMMIDRGKCKVPIQGMEVLCMMDPVEEYCAQQLGSSKAMCPDMFSGEPMTCLRASFNRCTGWF